MTVIAALLSGIVIGGILGLIGAGGAVVAVPVFLYVFGFDPLAATTASLAVVAVSAASGALPRMRMQQVRLRDALVFWSLGVPGAFVGARVATVIAPSLIIAGFAVVMTAAAVAMWRKSSKPPADVPADEPRTRARWLLPAVALLVGLLTGVFGIGGGFLVVPALVLVFGLPFGLATGTSLVVVALNSVTALAFKWDSWDAVDWHIPLLVIIGGLAGSLVASRMTVAISRRVLERGFAVVLVLLAAWMVAETVLA